MTGAPEVVNLNMMLIRAIGGKKALDVGRYFLFSENIFKVICDTFLGVFAGFSAMGSALAVSNDGTVVGMDITDSYWNQVGRRHAEAVCYQSHLQKLLT